MAVAHGGQILVLGATAGLVGDDRCAGDRAPRPRRAPPARPRRARSSVFQVLRRGPAARSSRRSRSLDAAPGNLPVQLTLVRRAATTSWRGSASALDEHRLVTLTGVGGVGKTRLALQVAAECAAALPRRRVVLRARAGRRRRAMARGRRGRARRRVRDRACRSRTASSSSCARQAAAPRARQLRAPARRRRRGSPTAILRRVPRRTRARDEPRGARRRRRARLAAALARRPDRELDDARRGRRPATRCGSSSTAGDGRHDRLRARRRRTRPRSPRSAAGSTASRSRSSSPRPGPSSMSPARSRAASTSGSGC